MEEGVGDDWGCEDAGCCEDVGDCVDVFVEFDGGEALEEFWNGVWCVGCLSCCRSRCVWG